MHSFAIRMVSQGVKGNATKNPKFENDNIVKMVINNRIFLVLILYKFRNRYNRPLSFNRERGYYDADESTIVTIVRNDWWTAENKVRIS